MNKIVVFLFGLIVVMLISGCGDKKNSKDSANDTVKTAKENNTSDKEKKLKEEAAKKALEERERIILEETEDAIKLEAKFKKRKEDSSK